MGSLLIGEWLLRQHHYGGDELCFIEGICKIRILFVLNICWYSVMYIYCYLKVKEITHLIEAEKQFRSDFFNRVTCELRFPLFGVIGSLDVINSSTFPKKYNRLMNVVKSCCMKLMLLINEVVDIAKIEENRLAFYPTMTDVHECLLDVLSIVSSKANLKKLSIPDQIYSEHMKIFVDPYRLRQILITFLDNAIGLTPDNSSIKVWYNVIKKPDPMSSTGELKSFVQFTIRCNGIHIDNQSIMKLSSSIEKIDFQTFYLSSAKTVGSGAEICKYILAKMGGHLNVFASTSKKKYTKMEIAVPVVEESESFENNKPTV